MTGCQEHEELLTPLDAENPASSATIPREVVNEAHTGPPTVSLLGLKKSFDGQVVVNKLRFDMYENQIFALLGHNGAGTCHLIALVKAICVCLVRLMYDWFCFRQNHNHQHADGSATPRLHEHRGRLSVRTQRAALHGSDST